MHDYLQKHLILAGCLGVVAVAIVVGVLVSSYNQRELEAYLRNELQEQEKTMVVLAEITGRNGADEAIERTINDCSRRNEFESLLIKLGTLSKKDLISVQNLFEDCGSFYAERKALMVAKLERELQQYQDLLDLLSVLHDDEKNKYRYAAWEEIVSLEKTRSSLLDDQVVLQGKIISVLMSGASVLGKEVGELTQQAQEINDLLLVNNQRIENLRKTLKE